MRPCMERNAASGYPAAAVLLRTGARAVSTQDLFGQSDGGGAGCTVRHYVGSPCGLSGWETKAASCLVAAGDMEADRYSHYAMQPWREGLARSPVRCVGGWLFSPDSARFVAAAGTRWEEGPDSGVLLW